MNTPCPVAIRCPGGDFGNYSTECSDADFVASRTYCLLTGQTVNISFRASGIGPFTWDIGQLPPGLYFKTGEGIAFGNPDQQIAFGNPDAAIQLVFGQPQAGVSEADCPGLIVILGIATDTGLFTTTVKVTDGYGNSTSVVLTFSISETPSLDYHCGYVPVPPIVCPDGSVCAESLVTVEFCDGTNEDFNIPEDPVAAQAMYEQIAQIAYRHQAYCNQNGGNPPSILPWLWFNQPQTCTLTCPDGSFFYYTVPAGRFAAWPLSYANDKAYAYACKQAQKLFICISPDSLPDGKVGVNYLEIVEAIGGTEPYTFTLDSGTLPPGLTLDSFGIISGVPTTAGSYPFVVKVTDSTP